MYQKLSRELMWTCNVVSLPLARPGDRQSRWDEPSHDEHHSIGRLSAEHTSSRQSVRPNKARHRQENVFIPPQPERFFSQSPMNSIQETDRQSEESGSMSHASSSLGGSGPTELELAAFKAGQKSANEALRKSQARIRDLENIARKGSIPVSDLHQKKVSLDQQRTESWATQQREFMGNNLTQLIGDCDS